MVRQPELVVGVPVRLLRQAGHLDEHRPVADGVPRGDANDALRAGRTVHRHGADRRERAGLRLRVAEGIAAREGRERRGEREHRGEAAAAAQQEGHLGRIGLRRRDRRPRQLG